MNISSLIVDARPDLLPTVTTALQAVPGLEIHAATEQGKLIVTLESANDADILEATGRISALDGVMSVAMVYHQLEPNPEDEV